VKKNKFLGGNHVHPVYGFYVLFPEMKSLCPLLLLLASFDSATITLAFLRRICALIGKYFGQCI